MPEASARQMVLTTVLEDALFFHSMQGYEEVSRLFEYQVLALSDNPDLADADILGTAASVKVEVLDDSFRHFHGIVASFGIDGIVGRYHRYKLVLRPWLWLLTRSADLRIFQEQTAVDIVQAVFGDYESNFSSSVNRTPATRTYCVQYRETDFNFVSRLLEEEGINYYFKHTESGHEMVLCDAASAHAAYEGFGTVRFHEHRDDLGEIEALTEWRMTHEIQPGKFVLRDWNFETPATDLTSTEAAGSRSHAEAEHEVYDYPGLYPAKAGGDALGGLRLDEASSRFARYTGEGNVTGLCAGYKFTLAEHPRGAANTDYIVLSTEIRMQVAGYESASGGGEQTGFTCRLTAQPAAEPLRPQRITRKPAVAGPQTAIVVGDADAGDILTDEHGRVKVQFHWDRIGTNTAQSSCWIRVSMPSSSNGWGFFTLPRIGDEVVVDFLEGDPDRPLITGRVHNAMQKTPYPLPANATVSTWKSRSKLGAADKFNEVRFEDKAGSEYVLMQAQKDRLEFVEETLKAKIGKEEHRTVLKQSYEKFEDEHHWHIVKDVKWKFDAKWSVGVTGDMLLKTDGKYSLKTGADVVMKIGANWGADASSNVHIKAGSAIVIEGGSQVTIKAGGSSVVLGPDGVSITGAMVKINSGGSPGSGGGASPTDPDEPTDATLPEDPLSHR